MSILMQAKLFSLRSMVFNIGSHCDVVHCLVRERKDAWPFRHPVDDQYAPGYLDVVKVCVNDPLQLQRCSPVSHHLLLKEIRISFTLIFIEIIYHSH